MVKKVKPIEPVLKSIKPTIDKLNRYKYRGTTMSQSTTTMPTFQKDMGLVKKQSSNHKPSGETEDSDYKKNIDKILKGYVDKKAKVIFIIYSGY